MRYLNISETTITGTFSPGEWNMSMEYPVAEATSLTPKFSVFAVGEAGIKRLMFDGIGLMIPLLGGACRALFSATLEQPLVLRNERLLMQVDT